MDFSFLYDQEIWGASKGIGSHFTFDMGPVFETYRSGPIGEFHVWIAGCPWRARKEGKILFGSLNTEFSDDQLAMINGQTIVSIFQASDSFGLTFQLSNGVALEAFIVDDEVEETVNIFSKHTAYTFQPNGEFVIEDNN